MSTAGDGSVVAGLRAGIASNLRSFDRVPAREPLTRAAVALVILPDGKGGGWIPLFVRAAGLSRHPGQFALPGGKLNRGEQAEAAALRELHEELGVAVSHGDVLGTLDDFDTRSGFTITPVVVWSDSNAADLKPSPDEVEELFLLTLSDLRTAVAGATRGTSRAFCLELPWGPVYAPTAAMLYQFSEVAMDGRPTRVNDFYQPPFARR